jgi:signal transduction histidine kinase
MLLEIILAALVLIVGVLVTRDIAIRQTPGGSPGLLARQGRDAERQVTDAARTDGVAAGQADLPRPEAARAAPRKTSRSALQNWSVRSRLILLVCIPSVIAIVLAADRIVSSLRSTALMHGTGAARDRAIASAAVECLIAAAILVLAVVAMAKVGRSMVRPLRRLQADASDVAERRLPEAVRRINEAGEQVFLDVEPIDVSSSDEIGAVARAFDQVHREALRLAANEAGLRGNVNAMFVNLSRRSQSLVERQLRLIDDLEQGEQDPERLASLFQMDHLATRMRRNSENLLVLAGHDEAKRRNQPVALLDVVRAALSEIEHYERITLNVQPGIAVRGQAVSDVVHLTAELVENATSFSAAEMPVTIAGHLLSSGGVLLEITDQGVGMGSEELAHANWRLDNPPVVDVAVSRRMGLFVVARLAARHGIRVRLRTAVGGLVALVWLPDEAIIRQSAAGPPSLRGLSASLTAEQDAVGAPAPLRPPASYAPLRVDAASTSPDVTVDAAQEAASMAAGPRGPEPSPGPELVSGASDDRGGRESAAGTAVPPANSLAQENRLPIFEAVESDWFRRGGGQVMQRFGPAEDASSGWLSPAAKGWQAAEAVLAPVTSGVTAAGLPKRTPSANLVPGTAAGASPAGAQAPPVTRSAAETRDRLASFQRAIKQARATAGGQEPGDGRGGAGGEDEPSG